MQRVSHPDERVGDLQRNLSFSSSTFSPTLLVQPDTEVPPILSFLNDASTPNLVVRESDHSSAHLPAPNTDAYTSTPCDTCPNINMMLPSAAHSSDKLLIFEDSELPSCSHTPAGLDSGPSDSGFNILPVSPSSSVDPKTIMLEIFPMSISVTEDIQDMVNSPTLPDVALLQITDSALSALSTDPSGHQTSISSSSPKNVPAFKHIYPHSRKSTPVTASILVDFSMLNAPRTTSLNDSNGSAPIAFKIPPVATYAEATNLAARFPEYASEILVQPLSSTRLKRPIAGWNANGSHKLHARKKTGSSHTHTPSSVSSEGPEHSSSQPNWARAPSPDYGKPSLTADTQRKRGRNEKEGSDTKRRWQELSPPDGNHDQLPVLIQAPVIDHDDSSGAYTVLGSRVSNACIGHGIAQVGSPRSLPCGEATHQEADVAALDMLFQASMNIQPQQRDNDIGFERIGHRPLEVEQEKKARRAVTWQMRSGEKDSRPAVQDNPEIASILQQWRIVQGGMDIEARHRRGHGLISASAGASNVYPVNPSCVGPTGDFTVKHPQSLNDSTSHRIHDKIRHNEPNMIATMAYNDITNDELEWVSSVRRGELFGFTGPLSTQTLPEDVGYENSFIPGRMRAKMVAPLPQPTRRDSHIWGGNGFGVSLDESRGRQHHHMFSATRPPVEPATRLNHGRSCGTRYGEGSGNEWV